MPSVTGIHATQLEGPTRHVIIGFTESTEGYRATINTVSEGRIWSHLIKSLAFDDSFIDGLSPQDALRLGFWLALEAT